VMSSRLRLSRSTVRCPAFAPLSTSTPINL
jgi:hypothetical protein